MTETRLGLESSAAFAATTPHHRSVVFAVAAFVFFLVAGGLLLMEIIAGITTLFERERRVAELPARTGYWGLVTSVMTGPAPKVFRARALVILAVSGVVALVALIV
jgi:hypothetical protein